MTPKRTRRRYTAEFKVEVALAALTERQPLTGLAAHYQLANTQITRWKLQLREQAAQVFRSLPIRPPPARWAPMWNRCTRLLAGCKWKTHCLKNAGAMAVAQQRALVAQPDPLGAGPLPGPGPFTQQLLLPALRGKCVQPPPHAPAR